LSGIVLAQVKPVGMSMQMRMAVVMLDHAMHGDVAQLGVEIGRRRFRDLGELHSPSDFCLFVVGFFDRLFEGFHLLEQDPDRLAPHFASECLKLERALVQRANWPAANIARLSRRVRHCNASVFYVLPVTPSNTSANLAALSTMCNILAGSAFLCGLDHGADASAHVFLEAWAQGLLAQKSGR
jgi:hypothetical protein